MKPVAVFGVVYLTEQTNLNVEALLSGDVQNLKEINSEFILAHELAMNTTLESHEKDIAFEFYNEIDQAIKSNQEFSISLKRFDEYLENRTFFSDERLTVCDLCIYQLFRSKSVLRKLKKCQKSIPNIYRYFISLHGNAQIQQIVKKMMSSDEEMKKEMKKSIRKIKDNLEIVNANQNSRFVIRIPYSAFTSGHLHIQYLKYVILNSVLARKYNAELIVRIEDTNPDRINEDYDRNILSDLERLGISPDLVVYSSDHFEKCLEFAELLIRDGKAYLDDTSTEKIRELKLSGIESENRNNGIKKNLEMWNDLIKGNSKNGKIPVLRAKIDLESGNRVLRDPILFRFKETRHQKYETLKAFPTFDFSCPISDSLDGVTHVLRTTELQGRNDLYNWILDSLYIRKPTLINISSMPYEGIKKLMKFVNEQLVEGWDDPRFPTLQGLLRKGMTVEAIENIIMEQGLSNRKWTFPWEKLWSENSKVLDSKIPRFCAIDKEAIVRLCLTNGPESVEMKLNPKHKRNPLLGMKETFYTKEIYLDRKDVSSIELFETISLIDWGTVTIQQINKDSNGNIIELGGIFETKFTKTKKKLNWLPFNPEFLTQNVQIITYGPLTVYSSNDEEIFNENSKIIEISLGDLNFKTLKKGEIIQLERRGNFICEKEFDGDRVTLIKIPRK